MEILVIFTCFNRKVKTENCIKTVVTSNKECKFSFIVADDGSTDGTYEKLLDLKKEFNIQIIRGKGNWYYAGGMSAAMEYALKNTTYKHDYVLIVNDDVEFLDKSVQHMISQSISQDNAVIVGAMLDDKKELSYGAVKYISGYQYRKMKLSEWYVEADTFNANCVLIPFDGFIKTGKMDSFYKHSLGDFDYGLSLKRNGYKIYQSKEFVGCCNNNDSKGTWTDSSLRRIERIKKKESIKGAPTKQWFYFLKKNFGIFFAIKGTVSPYMRILLGK